MIYLKNFENLLIEPEIGDFVVCEEKIYNDQNLTYFISSNIGIYAKFDHIPSFADYIIIYKNVPKDIQDNFTMLCAEEIKSLNILEPYYPFGRRMIINEIIKFSKNKKELEEFIFMRKYNI